MFTMMFVGRVYRYRYLFLHFIMTSDCKKVKNVIINHSSSLGDEIFEGMTRFKLKILYILIRDTCPKVQVQRVTN